jgi:hypothetical protein
MTSSNIDTETLIADLVNCIEIRKNVFRKHHREEEILEQARKVLALRGEGYARRRELP